MYHAGMARQKIPGAAGLVLTLGTAAGVALAPVRSMWGLNHFIFLPEIFSWVLWTAGIMALLLMAAGTVRSRAGTVSPALDRVLWERAPWGRIVTALGAVALFYFFRSETHFLGDGYTLIAVFGVEGTPIRKWPEPLSIFLIELMQDMLGGPSRPTMIDASRICSIASGAVVVYNLISIPRKLSESPVVRAIGTVTLVLSGSLLLFFGYVEYYPLLWAAGTAFVSVGIDAVADDRKLLPAVVLFVITVLMHLQALFFLPGVVYLLMRRVRPGIDEMVPQGRTLAGWGAGGLVLFIGLAAAVEATMDPGVFLPLFEGFKQSPDYFLFSGMHLWDLLNEILVMVPGGLILLAWAGSGEAPWRRDSVSVFLLLLSAGPVLFLLTIDPVLGMGRDWDLMALTLLSPVLLLLRQGRERLARVPVVQVGAYALVCLVLSGAYVAANVRREASESRFGALLRLYDTKDPSAWAIYGYYYLNENRPARAVEIGRAMLARSIRPGDAHYMQGVAYRKMGDDGAAAQHLHEAVKERPDNPRWLNELGQVYLDAGQLEQALAILKEARRYGPSMTFIAEGIGLTWYRMGDFAAAEAVADTLFMGDLHSPGGHLLRMVVAISAGDLQAARYHYEQYLEYGKGRSDYEGIREFYRYLVE